MKYYYCLTALNIVIILDKIIFELCYANLILFENYLICYGYRIFKHFWSIYRCYLFLLYSIFSLLIFPIWRFLNCYFCLFLLHWILDPSPLEKRYTGGFIDSWMWTIPIIIITRYWLSNYYFIIWKVEPLYISFLDTEILAIKFYL